MFEILSNTADLINMVESDFFHSLCFIKMLWQRITICHSGHWERNEYVYEYDILEYMDVNNISVVNLLREILAQVDLNFECSLFYLKSRSNGRGNIKSL